MVSGDGDDRSGQPTPSPSESDRAARRFARLQAGLGWLVVLMNSRRPPRHKVPPGQLAPIVAKSKRQSPIYPLARLFATAAVNAPRSPGRMMTIVFVRLVRASDSTWNWEELQGTLSSTAAVYDVGRLQRATRTTAKRWRRRRRPYTVECSVPRRRLAFLSPSQVARAGTATNRPLRSKKK